MRNDVRQAIFEMYKTLDSAGSTRTAKHMVPIAKIVKEDFVAASFNEKEVHLPGDGCLTLPGWYRKGKEWDVLALDRGRLVAAVELKSINSKMSNNMNNRAEESLGTAFDATAALNKGLFGNSVIPPKLGYAMIVKECEESLDKGKDPITAVFPTDPAFEGKNYIERFQILCERLRLKNVYQAVWFVTANPQTHEVHEPSPYLTYDKFIAALTSALAEFRA